MRRSRAGRGVKDHPGRRAGVSLLGGLGLCLGACRPAEVPIVRPEDEPARRAAASFVHCVEAGAPNCVRGDSELGAWDAFSLLGWLASGSPTSILQVLPQVVESHADPRSVQGRLVQDIARYQMAVRGAECDPWQTTKLAPLVDQVIQGVEPRLTSLGLWNQDLAQVVAHLSEEARTGLAGGYLVGMRCMSDPFRLYVATSGPGLRQSVVGMTTALPGFLGGPLEDRAVVEERLHSRTLGLDRGQPSVPEGTVDPWIPLPLEVF